MALNYILAMPRVACVIPGFRNDRQAKCNIAGAGKAFSADDVKSVQDVLA
jgi:aryl-alcohol dehydrogenase-like predicted oxidoreductase